jgi:hypothetical protein
MQLHMHTYICTSRGTMSTRETSSRIQKYIFVLDFTVCPMVADRIMHFPTFSQIHEAIVTVKCNCIHLSLDSYCRRADSVVNHKARDIMWVLKWLLSRVIF